MTDSTFLLIGLGNPGRDYKNNRHNVGFMFIDWLSNRLGARMSRVQSKALIATSQYEDFKLILAKPQTYMNLSGASVQGLAHFYKLPLKNVLIAHDDLDLPFGVLRLRPGGGPGGQKGIASTIERLGTKDFPRLRIGIGRPPGRMDPAAYVLQDFSKADRSLLPEILDHAANAALMFVRDGLETAMNKFNGDVTDKLKG